MCYLYILTFVPEKCKPFFQVFPQIFPGVWKTPGAQENGGFKPFLGPFSCVILLQIREIPIFFHYIPSFFWKIRPSCFCVPVRVVRFMIKPSRSSSLFCGTCPFSRTATLSSSSSRTHLPCFFSISSRWACSVSGLSALQWGRSPLVRARSSLFPQGSPQFLYCIRR